MSSGLVQRKNWPETGKPPKPLISLMPDFCSSGRAPPPAPTKTNTAYAQNWRETWNCSLIVIALEMSTEPSAACGV